MAKSDANTGIFKLRQDKAGREKFHTVFGDQISVPRNADFMEQFQYNVNTKTLLTTTVGSGTATQANSMLHLETGTDTNGSTMVESKNTIKYHSGFEAYALFTAQFQDGGVADSVQHIGPFTVEDGYYIGYTNTDFVVGRLNGGVATEVSSNNFNGDHNILNKLDTTKLNIFRISYGWLGTATITFEWKTPYDGWVVMHQFQLENTQTVPNTTNPQLPIRFDVTKTDGATNIHCHSASWCGGHNGPETHAGDRYFTGIVGPSTVSAETVLINFYNVSTFQSKTNRVLAEGVRVGVSSDGTKNAIIKMYKNLTITSPSWSNVDATNSIMQTDTAGTVTPNDDNLVWDYPLAKNDSVLDDIQDIDLKLSPGDTMTITGQSAANTDLTFTARWREHF